MYIHIHLTRSNTFRSILDVRAELSRWRLQHCAPIKSNNNGKMPKESEKRIQQIKPKITSNPKDTPMENERERDRMSSVCMHLDRLYVYRFPWTIFIVHPRTLLIFLVCSFLLACCCHNEFFLVSSTVLRSTPPLIHFISLTVVQPFMQARYYWCCSSADSGRLFLCDFYNVRDDNIFTILG